MNGPAEAVGPQGELHEEVVELLPVDASRREPFAVERVRHRMFLRVGSCLSGQQALGGELGGVTRCFERDVEVAGFSLALRGLEPFSGSLSQVVGGGQARRLQ